MTIDWALPSVFLADAVEHDYHPVATVQGATVGNQIEKYDFAEGPVFCGRSTFFGLYDQLMSPGGLNVLAIYSEGDTRGLGKTRILREYGTRSLLDGHVPCVVGLDGQDRPTDPRRFAEALLLSIGRARLLFHLNPPASPALISALAPPGEPAPQINLPWREWKMRVTELMAQYRAAGQPLDRDRLRVSIAADLAALIQDARDGEDPRIDERSRALVLLDTVEEWGDTLELFAPGILSQYGLGDEEEEVPVAVAFRAGAGLQDALLQGLVEFTAGKRWIQAEKLQPLAEGDEEDLAYRWILLNANPKVAPPMSEKVYTVSNPQGQWRKWFGFVTKRVPARLSDPEFYGAVQVLEEGGDLRGSDDNEALAFLLGSRR